MRDFALHIFWGLFAVHLLGCLVGCMQLRIVSDPSSCVGGYYPLGVEITTSCDYPESPSLLLSQLWLSSDAEDCSALVQLEGSLMELLSCSSKEGVIRVNINSGEMREGAKIKVTVEGVRYGSEKYPNRLTVRALKDSMEIEEAVNDEDWIAQGLAKLQKFSLSPTSPVTTCQLFHLALSGIPILFMPQGSFIEISFDSDVDLSDSTSPDLEDLQRTARSVVGATKKEYSASDQLTISLQNIKAPPIGKGVHVTMKTLTALRREVHEETGELRVAPENFTHSEGIELTGGKGVCELGTYTVQMAPRCLPIPNARYKIFSPNNIFGIQEVNISSHKALDGKTAIDFNLNNPCSRIPGAVLSSEVFNISVYGGDQDEIAFTAAARLPSSISYEFGKLLNFKVEPEHRNSGYEGSYTFSMKAYNSIPQNGKILLTLNSSVEAKPNLTASMNGIETTAVCSSGEIVVTVPTLIPSFTDIRIDIKDLKNPYELNVYSGFSATSFNDIDYGIDESGEGEVRIDEPEVGLATCGLSNVRNREMAEYSFTLTSAVATILPGDIIAVKVPPEIAPATCSAADNVPADPLHLDEHIDHWLTITHPTTPTRVDFKLTCKNPSLTATTGHFKILLLRPNGLKLLKGEVSVKTEQGAYLKRKECSMECDKTCPRCHALCRLTLVRNMNTGFSTVVIASDLLNLELLSCKYDGGDQSNLSTCTILEDEKGKKIKLTISSRRVTNTIKIKDIGIIYPEYSEAKTYPIDIRTYTTKDISSESLLEEDEAAVISGTCDYPCKTCREGHSKCDSCIEDLASGEEYYYYPDHAVECSSALGTSCRFLEDGKCCKSYYKNETSRECIRCSSECKQCQGSGDYCTECADSGLLAVEGRCASECGEGFYKNTSRTCSPCSSNCKSCASSTICTRCYSDFNLYQAACVSSCPEGTYTYDNICKPCDEKCAACHESSSRCTKCHSHGKEYLLLSLHMCVEKCEGDMVVLDEENKICAFCNSNCAECKGTTTFCSKCQQGKFLNETAGLCLSTCVPNGYNKGTVCAQCENYCATCLNATHCLSCLYGLVLVTTTNECKGSCPRQFYEVDSKCYPCNTSCETCGNASTCFSCVDGYYLAKGQCYRGGCPPGTFNSFGKICEECDASCSGCKGNRYSCIECAPNYYPDNDKCLLSCPVGKTLINERCMACDDDCYSCVESTDFCTSCKSGKYFYKNKCLNTCPELTAPSASNTCMECLEGCRECGWNGSDSGYPEDCSACLSGYRFLEAKCYSHCPHGYMSSPDNFSCVLDISLFTLEMKFTKFYPFIIAAPVLCLLVTILHWNNKQVLIIPSYIVVLNYIAIPLYALIIATAFSKRIIEVIVITGASMAIQLVLNLWFVVRFRREAKDDVGHRLWRGLHVGRSRTMVVLSCLLSFQTHRLLYSRFLDPGMLFERLGNLRRLLKPLALFSTLQLILVQGPAIVLSCVEFCISPDMTRNQMLLTESFILSSSLALLIWYEDLCAEKALEDYEKEHMSRARSGPSRKNLAMVERGNGERRRLRRPEQESFSDDAGNVRPERLASEEGKNESQLSTLASKFRRRRSTSLVLPLDSADSSTTVDSREKPKCVYYQDEELKIEDIRMAMIVVDRVAEREEHSEEDFNEQMMDEGVQGTNPAQHRLPDKSDRPLLQKEDKEEDNNRVEKIKKPVVRKNRKRPKRRIIKPKELVKEIKKMPLEAIPEGSERNEDSQSILSTPRFHQAPSSPQV